MSEAQGLLRGKAPEPTYEQKLAKSCVAEFIGTFFLCSTIALCGANPADTPMAPIAIGFSLMVGIFALGHVSGAHFNPAVTLGVWMRGKIDPVGAGFYVVTQIVAAFIAGGIMRPIAEDAGYNSGYPAVNTVADVNAGSALVLEFLFTFLLVTVILNTATTKATANNSFYGLAIGSVVTAGAYSAGSVSGGAFNPAVGIALPAVHGVGKDIWIYIVGPLFGGAAAAGVFMVTANADEFE